MNIPNEEDWLNWPAGADRPLDLDEDYARRRFAGKSFEEALELFETTNVLSCCEDVSYMPPVPFRYYMLVFKAYVLAVVEKVGSDKWSSPDAASCFLNLVERKLKTEFDWIAPIMKDLLPAVEFVATNQEKYEADSDIYGDFREQLTRIKSLWGA